MSDEWDFYPLRVDDEPASIYLDLGLGRDAPIESQPHMAYIRVFMRQPRPDGLSSNEEFDDLVKVEDSLTERFSGGGGNATYAGRNTSSGNRDFYFYTADPVAFAESVEATMTDHPHYQFEIGSRPDPEWDVYFGFLYPSPDDLQRILNRRVTDNLAAHGDNLSEPRPIDHLAYMPTAASAADLRDFLRGQGFAIDEPRIEGGSVALAFKRSDRPDRIDEVVVPVARRVQELGGEYDGWGCEVVTERH
jgi:hypothetical protein